MRTTCIALLRAVNVGGANSLRTADFVRVLERVGLQSVRTYIQTGNAVFHTARAQTAGLSNRIKAEIRRAHGFAPDVLVLTLRDLQRAVASNPYPEVDSNPKALHVMFLSSAPKKPDLAILDSAKKASERFALKGKIFYLHAPDGVGRSKLSVRIERSLGVWGTARNWRTTCKLLEIAREVDAA